MRHCMWRLSLLLHLDASPVLAFLVVGSSGVHMEAMAIQLVFGTSPLGRRGGRIAPYALALGVASIHIYIAANSCISDMHLEGSGCTFWWLPSS